jgi:hypothetical protein
MASACLSRATFSRLRSAGPKLCARSFSFTFAGPRTLDEVVKKELIENKTGAEIADVWYTYHEEKVGYLWGGVEIICYLSATYCVLIFALFVPKDNVVGLVLKGKEGESVLTRADKW